MDNCNGQKASKIIKNRIKMQMQHAAIANTSYSSRRPVTQVTR